MTTISDERLADHALNLKMGYLNTEVREMARELQSARVTIREQAERIERLEQELRDQNPGIIDSIGTVDYRGIF